MKKKHFLTFQDKSDWEVFTKKMGHISEKESDLLNENFEIACGSNSLKILEIEKMQFSCIDHVRSQIFVIPAQI